MKNYKNRDKKINKRKNKMRISGRSLLTVIAPIQKNKTQSNKKNRKSK